MDHIKVTLEGKKKLEEELEHRKISVRKEIKEAIKYARAQGDLSENADYSAAKEDQSLNETRIQELENMLKSVEIIEEDESNDQLNINRRALVKFYDTDTVEEITLVSSVEADIGKMKISIDSPIGIALFKKKVNIKVKVEAPDYEYDVEILKIFDK
ncbi:MAG: transcription elongation factor GreA [Oscillospiraceae bacterium]|nr:transcription elongation factor GreA [Oscillospiraceae bacterium]